MTADGQENAVKGLGGSQQSKAEDTVPGPLSTRRSQCAVIADFQNQWGRPGLRDFRRLSSFRSLLPWASGPPRTERGRQRHSEGRGRSGAGGLGPQLHSGLNVTLLLSFIGRHLPLRRDAHGGWRLLPGVPGHLIFIVGVALRPDRDWQSIPASCSSLMIGFGSSARWADLGPRKDD